MDVGRLLESYYLVCRSVETMKFIRLSAESMKEWTLRDPFMLAFGGLTLEMPGRHRLRRVVDELEMRAIDAINIEHTAVR